MRRDHGAGRIGALAAPVHTPLDGDSVFVVATGERPLADPIALELTVLGSLAADCLARAVGRAVFEAEALGPWEAYRTVHRQGVRRTVRVCAVEVQFHHEGTKNTKVSRRKDLLRRAAPVVYGACGAEMDRS
jgi:hypothetical protein